jgi:hypothetical protein
MSHEVFNGIRYNVGDYVVVKSNDMEDQSLNRLGKWMWKAKITSISMHKFIGHHDLFFQVKTFQQISKVGSLFIVARSSISHM